MALRTGWAGLGYEASLGLVGLGKAPFGVAELGPVPGPRRGMLQLYGGFGCPFRLTLNSQLRTGTDSGNPTV